jgi:hypothetical protein
MNRVFAAVLVSVILFSCSQKKYNGAAADPLLYCKTVKALNNVVLESNFPPMIASRNYVYANIAAYETMALGNAQYQSLAGQIKHLVPMPDSAKIDGADYQYAALLAFCRVGEAVTFPEGSMQQYVDELKKKMEDAGMPAGMRRKSEKVAEQIAKHILAWSKKDNYPQTRTAPKFTVINEEGRWTPTPPMYAQGLEPHWRTIRPMLMDSAAQFMPVRPPAYDIKNKNGVYYKALLEVKQLGDSLTDEQKHIADFWDDNPFKMNVSGHVMFATKKFSPPGHWMNIVGIAAKEAKADFGAAVAAYAATSIALFDGFISCWDEKYRSATARPETVINKHLSADWRPYIQTPPFPSYTSGHSTISAAAAETMTAQLGDNLAFTDTSLLEFGIANQRITSFRGAAQEASMSRVYGGIHFRFDCDNGAVAGKKLGEFIVNRLQLRKK